MRKMIFISCFIGFLFADVLINKNELPKTTQDFLNIHFKNTNIALIEKEWDGFEIKFQNGIKAEFNANGDLKKIKSKYQALPDDILKNILIKAKQSQNGANLMEIEREIGGYELKFDNNMEVFVDEYGEIKYTKFDD